jgi:S1-C subfamily serine protease
MAEWRHNANPGPEPTFRPEPASHRQPRTRHPVAVGAAAAVAVLTLGGVALGPSGLATTRTIAGHPTAAATATSQAALGPDSAASSANSTAATGATRTATSAEEVGVVDITTVLDYGQGAAAGTGLVLTPAGEILTNNHVIQDATRIRVTVVSTGSTYTASVVGTDPTDDVAVLRLSGAANLATAHLANDSQASQVAVGDRVTAVGNAGGTGGDPTAATGSVVALGRDITASDETGADPERLSGLIQVNADVQAGDSGGPLYSDGVVVGIDTAASASAPGGFATAADTREAAGFAIPITTATAIADRIVAGESSSTVHQGAPAFLGVQITRSRAADGATIAGVVPSSPAASAGLAAGDTITAVDGTAVDSSQTLSEVLAGHQPRDRVTVSWTDSASESHTATVTLTTGPAD